MNWCQIKAYKVKHFVKKFKFRQSVLKPFKN